MADPAQILKSQIGELVWNMTVLQTQLETVTKERDDLKKQLEEKNDDSSGS